MAQLQALLLLFHSFFFFLLVASALTYYPPLGFFINCGSHSNHTLDGRNFTADLNPPSFSFSQLADSTTPNSPLYDSATIFPQQSAYSFPIQTHGIFCLRLHFYAFNSNLQHAQFHVSTSNFSLFSTFSLPNPNAPVIKEFFLTINHTNFIIQFTPSHPKSFAFVNAIELFLLPEDFVMDSLIYTANNTRIPGVRSQVLNTIHRVNIGGQQTQDPLWRNWVTDDQYLISQALANKCVPYNSALGYGTLGAGPYSASDLVYSTCRELNLANSSLSVSPNITWVFQVTKNARHLIRLHFCNIIDPTTPDIPKFNLNIYDFTQLIDTSGVNASFSHFAAPFYFDLAVDSNDLGSLSVSVGSIQNSQAYLNGLEIMEFCEKLNLVPNKQRSDKFVFIIIGSVGGFIFLLLFGFVVFFGIKRKRKGKQQATELVSSRPYSSTDKASNRSTWPYMSPVPNLKLHLKMSLREVLDATDNFNENLLIGKGGFGKVYKGILGDGKKVAVKRSDPEHGQGISQFITEILILSKIRHRHLVSLIGYCDELSEMILVYEFMEKGTLRDHIYDSKSNLSWNQRLEICIGAARGLQYLHNGTDGGIIHRDVKSTNILLDENFVAKVADFGLSTSGLSDPEHFSIGIKGSFGYLDPEYFKTFSFTEKSDVYSFGVVLLEVLCARPAIISTATAKAKNVSLAEWGMHWQRKGQLEMIIDPLLEGKIKAASLRKFGETVEKCLRTSGEERPNMEQVVWDLEYVLRLGKTEAHEDSIALTNFSSINVLRLPSFGSSLLIQRRESNGEDAGAGDDDRETAFLPQPQLLMDVGT